MTQLMRTVEQAISGAVATLMRAEREHEAALTATRAAGDGLEEAQQVLDRFERLRDGMTGADVSVAQQV